MDSESGLAPARDIDEVNTTPGNAASDSSERRSSGRKQGDHQESAAQFLADASRAMCSHLQTWGEVFTESEKHELFILEKLSTLIKRASETEEQLKSQKQEIAEKLKVISRALRLDAKPVHLGSDPVVQD